MARRTWHYQGDIGLEYGGIFFDLSDWKHGYVEAVEVTDLDSACGFSGAVMVESKSINGTDDLKCIAESLSVIGASLLPNGDISDNGQSSYAKGTLAYKLCVAYALNAYGHYDTDRSEVVQPDRTCPVRYDGWKATRIRAGSLRSYVRKQFLGLSR